MLARTGGAVARRGRVAAPSLLAGLLLAASLPPWGWWPLAFFGAALLSWRLGGLRLRARLLAGWVAGLGWFVPGLWWAVAFNWYGAAALIVVEALFPAVAAALVPPGRWRLPAFAASFTLLEAARDAWPFGGLPVAGLFLGQANGPLLPAARLGGPLLLDALVLLAGAGVGTLATWGGRSARAHAGLGPLAAGGLALVATVGVVLGGAFAPDGGPAVGRVRVALVQGGGRRGTSATEVPAARVFGAQEAASARLSPSDGPRLLVVWPEDVIKVGRTLSGTRQATAVALLARRLGATVVAGVTETLSSTRFRNEIVAFGPPDGRVVGAYTKVHRVPFGEYVPDRSFFAHVADLSAVPLDAVPGHGSGELSTPAARIGLMVSYEVFFAGRGRSAVRAGARLLVVPTNTSSYATSQMPTMEVAADRLQAVAEGRDLVQAAPTGYSTVVDPGGAVLERSTLGRRQVLVAEVALRRGSTPYEIAGDLPVLAAAAVALAAAILVGLAERRGRRPGARSAAPPGAAVTDPAAEGRQASAVRPA